jgi:hypothetical protein
MCTSSSWSYPTPCRSHLSLLAQTVETTLAQSMSGIKFSINILPKLFSSPSMCLFAGSYFGTWSILKERRRYSLSRLILASGPSQLAKPVFTLSTLVDLTGPP